MGISVYQRLGRVFAPERFSPSRRTFLKATAVAGAGVALGGCATLRGGENSGSGPKGRIVVIGAGFSGLACACALHKAGIDVVVLEARSRVGGRVRSFNAVCGDEMIPGHNVEGGGELIGLNHLTWRALADEHGLEMLPVSDDDGLADPALWRGAPVDMGRARQLWEQLDAAHETLNGPARSIDADRPWDAPGARDMDRRSMEEWFAGLAASGLDELALACIRMEFEANNGVSLAQQSWLGTMAYVKGGGVEAFWSDSETMRCDGGNQLLALKMARVLGRRIRLQTAVTAVQRVADGFVVRTSIGERVTCDQVVVAVPPSVWGNIRFEPGLPTELSPQMGCNVKYLSAVNSRFWKDGEGGQARSQYGLVVGDQSRACMTWEGTDGQTLKAGEQACLTVFAGAEAARRMLKDESNERRATLSRELEGLFPGYTAHLGATRFMDWPRQQWTMASYSFPAPGQVTTVGPMLRRGGAAWGVPGLRFAGEHCDYAFVGFMEGALRSGVRVATEIVGAPV